MSNRDKMLDAYEVFMTNANKDWKKIPDLVLIYKNLIFDAFRISIVNTTGGSTPTADSVNGSGGPGGSAPTADSVNGSGGPGGSAPTGKFRKRVGPARRSYIAGRRFAPAST